MISEKREAEATLSALQHFAYCRRQWGLIFVERQWAENARTAEGQVFHQTAHHGPESEARGDLLILRGLRSPRRPCGWAAFAMWWSFTAPRRACR